MRWHEESPQRSTERKRKEDAAALVVQWLTRCCLAHYAQAFLDNGYDDLSVCSAIQDVDLDAIGVEEESHRQILRDAVATLKSGDKCPNLYFELESVSDRSNSAELEKTALKMLEPSQLEDRAHEPTAIADGVSNPCCKGSNVEHGPKLNQQYRHGLPQRAAHAQVGIMSAGEHSARNFTEAQRRTMAQIRFPRLHLLAMVRELLLRDRLDLGAMPFTQASGDIGDLDDLAEQFCHELHAQKRDVVEALDYFRLRKINFDKCIQQGSDAIRNDSKGTVTKVEPQQDRCAGKFAQLSGSVMKCDDTYYSSIPPSACVSINACSVTRLLLKCTSNFVNKKQESKGGMSHPKRSPFTKLFRRRFLKKNHERRPELIAADITMSDEDRVALMRQVRAGLITTEDAWNRVKEYERCRRQQQQALNAETQTSDDEPWIHPRFSPQLNLRKLAHLRLNPGSVGDSTAINRLFEEVGSSAPNSPSNCDSRRRRGGGRDFESPYQSDVSLSAPSSPTMESYYEIPYQHFALPPHPGIPHGQRHTYSPPRSGFFFGQPPPLCGVLNDSLSPPSTTTGEDTSSHSTKDSAGPRRRRPSTLGELLDRLGITHLSQTLTAHGISSLQDFSKLNCAFLSSIGVQDIEQRAKILTAVELMSDDDEEDGNVYNIPVDNSDHPRCSHIPQRDSGCYGSSDIVGHGQQVTHPNICAAPLTEENERGEDDDEEGVNDGNEAADLSTSRAAFQDNTTPRVKKTRIKLPTSALRMPRSTPHGDIECRLEITTDGYVANVFSNRGHPLPSSPPNNSSRQQANGGLVGSPRSASRQQSSLAHAGPPQPPGRANPASNSLRNHTDQMSAFVSLTNAKPNTAYSVASSSSSNSSQHRPVGGGVRASSFRHSSDKKHSAHFGSPKKPVQTTERLVEEKLLYENIRLSDAPYSSDSGHFGIPLRLIQRYSYELERDLRQVALAMEHIRETQLTEQRRNVVSHIEEIITDRYLNCDCIKTDNVNDFLVTVGLPMYISSFFAHCHHQKVSPTVDYLIRLPDSELVEEVGFSLAHSRCLKEAFVPSVHAKSKTMVSYLDKV